MVDNVGTSTITPITADDGLLPAVGVAPPFVSFTAEDPPLTAVGAVVDRKLSVQVSVDPTASEALAAGAAQLLVAPAGSVPVN